MRRSITVTTTVLLAVLAGGCTEPAFVGDVFGTASARSGADATVHDRWESCEIAISVDEVPEVAFTLPLLDDGFAAVSVIVCAEGPREKPDGTLERVVEETRTEPPAALLAALRLPDEDQGVEGYCTMDLPHVPWLALVDGDGRWIRPGIPIDSCGKPRTELQTAYADLVFTD